MINLNTIPTEQRNPNTLLLDTLGPLDIVRAINAEDKTVPLAIEKILPQIAEAAEKIAEAFKKVIIYLSTPKRNTLSLRVFLL